MSHKTKQTADKLMLHLTAGYIICPILIFLIFWVKLPIAFVCCGLIILFWKKLISGIEPCKEISITTNIRFWLIALVIIAMWVLFSGIGGFSYQTGDFYGRNPMFRDLYNYAWPVYYDLSIEPPLVQKYTGNAATASCGYYFSWWLPVASCSKVLLRLNVNKAIVDSISNILLYLWAVLGLFLVVYCLVRLLKKYSYWILSTLILFGGFDFLIYCLNNKQIPHNTHIEWWATLFQYTDNTAQLYWAFNQAIPIWLIIAFLLLIKNNKYMAGWTALGFAYSPFATLGLVPIVIAALFNQDKGKILHKLKNAVSAYNICIPIIMLVIFGSFYMQIVSGASLYSGFIFALYPELKTFTVYILFLFVEFLIYFIALGKIAKHYRFYWVVLFELLLIPLYRMGKFNDFSMRVSIPALFILMVLCLQRLFDAEASGDAKNKRIIIICLCLGYLTSCTEIQRNLTMTLMTPEENYLRNNVYSFGNIEWENEDYIYLHVNQYMSLDKDYKNSFFYKYLAQE